MTSNELYKFIIYPHTYLINYEPQAYFFKKPADVFLLVDVKKWETNKSFVGWVEKRAPDEKGSCKQIKFVSCTILLALYDDGYKWVVCGHLYSFVGFVGKNKPTFGLPEFEYKKRDNNVPIE